MHPAELVAHTLRLRDGLEPGRLAASWREAPTRGLERLVDFEGCALWLERRLRQIGAAPLVEPGFAAALRQRAHAEAAGNLLIDHQAALVARLLAEWDVPYVFLKGAARRAARDLYPFVDARATHDIDVLVPARAAQTVWDRFRALGYVPALPPGEIPSEHHHLPALWNYTRVAVEVHCSTSPEVAADLAWTRSNAGACELARDGIRLRIPSPTELLWNGLTHALRHRANAFRLHFLLDGAAIAASGAAIDWEEIAHRVRAGETGRRAGAWLAAAAWLAGPDSPPAVTGAARAFDLPAALRRRWSWLRYVVAEGRLGELLCWWTIAGLGRSRLATVSY